MKFPVQHGKSKAGLEATIGRCPVCGGPLNGEPGTFAFVNGGALRKNGRQGASPASDLIGFLSIGVHGAHSEEENAPSASVRIANEVPMGQFEFYFCSTACLRGFFNASVDALEEKLRGEHVA